VIAACVGALIAAIALVAANWPQLPARTLPQPATYIAMGGQAVEVPPAACLVPMIGELRKRPNWTLRVDDMRWTDYNPPEDPRHASIVIDASGAIWRDDWLHQQTMPLTAAELRDVMAAFELGCDVDESIPPTGAYEGRYINVAYGKTEKAAAKLDDDSPVVMRLGELFEAIRGRYIGNRAGATKQFVMKLAGVWRDGEGEDGWTKHAIEIDASKLETDAAERVAFVDWALALPRTRPAGRMTATGTFTMDGVTRPIAVNLDESTDENRGLRNLSLAHELTFWMSINRER
jgi:hypothetical protein